MNKILKGAVLATVLLSTAGCHAHIRTAPAYSYVESAPVVVVRVVRARPSRSVVVVRTSPPRRATAHPHRHTSRCNHHVIRNHRGNNHRGHYHNRHGKRVVCHRRH